MEKVTGEKGLIVAKNARYQNGQTVCLVLKEERSDITSIAFDLGGMDVSTGSACSSGGVLPSPVLQAMGFDEETAKSAIRFSFSPYVNKESMKEYAGKIIPIVRRFTSG